MADWSQQDEKWMRRALELAERGRGQTSPNPMVGCVIVASGEAVGEGWHQQAGGPHAEVVALEAAGELAQGATVYVTLEPCTHFGRTPPCVGALIEAGVARVVCALRDPTPAGGGLDQLAREGIEVAHGLLERQARRQNEAWLKWSVSRRPFVTLKLAATLDGRIASAGGKRERITCDESWERVHRLRANHDAVLVGVGTVLADDPWLTARPGGKLAEKQPLRVVLDSRLRTPDAARVADVSAGPTLIAVGPGHNARAAERFRARGVEIVELPGERGGVSLTALLDYLGGRSVVSLLVEGGSQVASSFVRQGLADKLVLYLAPKVLGQEKGVSMLGDVGITTMDQAIPLHDLSVERSGEDVEFVAYFGRAECSPA